MTRDMIELRCRDTGAVRYAGRFTSLRECVVKANLSAADLSGVDIFGGNLIGADICRARLPNAILVNANLTNANLTNARLARACLDYAILIGANLESADLTGASMRHANLAGANLCGANLTGADLRDARMVGANLTRANLADAIWRDGITLRRTPLAITGLRYPVWILDDHMQIDCEIHRIDEWESFDNREIARMDGHHARRFWDTHKAGLLALAAARKIEERTRGNR